MSTTFSPTASAGTFNGGLTASGTLANVDDAVSMPVVGCGCVGFQVVGNSWSGTITFEGSVDGSDWIAVNGVSMPGGVAATTTSSAGLYQVPSAGLTAVRARLSAISAGTVTVTAATSLAARST